MKFSKICLILLTITYAGSSIQAELPKIKKRVYFKVSGDIPKEVLVTNKRLHKGNFKEHTFGTTIANEKGGSNINIYIKPQSSMIEYGKYNINGYRIKKDSLFFRSNVQGRAEREFDDKFRHEGKFGKSDCIEIPSAIQQALKTQDKVNATIKFYTHEDPWDANFSQGKYKLISGSTHTHKNVGSFDILLADDQPETTHKPSESEAPTPTEKPAGSTPHSHAPGIEKDFKIFKEEVMNEIADLKKMVNHLMKKMNK